MEHIGASTSSVGTVVAVVMIGALVAPYIPSPKTTPKDLSFMVTAVGVPMLMFSHMAADFTPDMLSAESATLACFALLGITVGGACGHFIGRCLFRTNPHFITLLIVGCGFQNTVIFPLSLVRSLDVAWLSPEMVQRCTAYVFTYSVTGSLVFWTAGPEYIRRAAAAMRGDVAPAAPNQRGRVFNQARTITTVLWTGSFVGILIGVVCGLTQVRETAPGVLGWIYTVLFNAAATLGMLPVPISLMLLGVSLRATATTGASYSEAPLSDLRSLAIAMATTRLIIVPFVMITIFHFILSPLLPQLTQDPSFLIILVLESSAPSAVSCLLLFTTFSFLPGSFGLAVFVQYILSIVSSTLWLTFALWYVEWRTNVLTATPAPL